MKKGLSTGAEQQLDKNENTSIIRYMSNQENKTQSEKQVQKYAEIFRALSNPNRLKIFLELIAYMEPGSVCTSDAEKADACQLDMARRLDIAPSTVSHHIKELKHAGLITIQRNGRNVSLQINPKNVALLKDFLQK
ncbi:MAG: helix-turn-helix domain-containing protein [Desulfotalea sp.]